MAAGKQIVFCTDGIFPHAVGGMQRHSALLITELAKGGEFDITVIHPHATPVFPPSLNIREIALNHKPKGKNYLLECYRYSAMVYNELLKFPSAVIYSQGLSVWKGINRLGKRVIVNPHGLEPFQTIDKVNFLKTAPMRLVFRYIYKNAARIVSLGGKLTAILRSQSPRNAVIEVIPNAVTVGVKPQRSFDKQTYHLLFVGRFADNKGIPVLMQAIDQLNREGYASSFHYHLVGKGPLYEEYIKKYAFPNITFHGFANDEDLQKMYVDYDAFVFPTLYEGMPTVVLEAMAAGMPVIVSDTGATAELVDNKNGYLIEKNNVRALKSALQGYYRLSAAERERMSEASYVKVKNNFTWPVVASMHAQLFNTFSS